MALLSQTALRSDPILNHNFVVSLIDTSSTLAILGSAALSAIFDVALGGFSECSGLEMSLKTEDYREGGANGAVQHFPSRVEWGAITLKKGMGSGTALWDWHYGFVEGRGKRRDGVIVLMTGEHLPNNIWYFSRGLPSKYSGPQMNATQNGVAIESIEIVHEGIYQVPFVGAASSVVSTAANVAGGLL
ncbi:MAG TPA: phage tail protein [Vicinamibacterales bacterium]